MFGGLFDPDGTFSDFNTGDAKKILGNREKSEEVRDETIKVINDFARDGECGLAEKKFKFAAFALDAQVRTDPELAENAKSVLRDVKKEYPGIVECYKKQNDCDAASKFYGVMKDQGSVFNLENENDKEVLGESLLDVAGCYEDDLENEEAKAKYEEVIRDFGGTSAEGLAKVKLEKSTGELLDSDERALLFRLLPLRTSHDSQEFFLHPLY